MTAGRGIVHSEMPVGDEEGHGLQLWINLSQKDKMVEPNYQELLSKDIPVVEKGGVKVRVIAGEAMGKKVRNGFVIIISILIPCFAYRVIKKKLDTTLEIYFWD